MAWSVRTRSRRDGAPASPPPTTHWVRQVDAVVRRGGCALVVGDVTDDVLIRGRPRRPRTAVAQVLVASAARAVVVWHADESVRVHPPERDGEVRELLARRLPELPELGRLRGTDAARAARALLQQEQMPVAVLVADAHALLADGRDSGAAVAAELAEAVEHRRTVIRGPAGWRNPLVVLAHARDDVPPGIADHAACATIEAGPPTEGERRGALLCLAGGFHGAGRLAAGEREAAAGRLAEVTPGATLIDLVELGHLSRAREIPLTDHRRLVEAHRARGEAADDQPQREQRLAAIAEGLRDHVSQQDAALALVGERLLGAADGDLLDAPERAVRKPGCVLFLTGPSAVGKTETLRAVARGLFGSEDHLLRIDCGELHDEFAVARLTGAPPGYVGHESGGILTDALIRDPRRVVLFDEIEKADRAIAPVLLAILEEGTLTDGRGQVARFGDCVLAFTSNRGGIDIAALRDPTPSAVQETALAAISAWCHGDGAGDVSSPALWTRIRAAVVGFAPLGADAVEGIVAKFVRNLVANMADRHDLAIDVDAALVASALRPPETQAWDGRYVKEELERVLVRPLRRQRMLLAPPRGSRCAVEVGPDGICRLEVVGAVASAV